MNPLIGYSYSTSDNAKRFGCYDTGCYYLSVDDEPIAGGFATFGDAYKFRAQWLENSK